MEHSGQVLSVVSKPTSKGNVYEAEIGGMKFSTFKDEIGGQLAVLQGKMVKVAYTTKSNTGRNGQTYVNNYLDDITEDGSLPTPALRDNVTEQVQGGGQVVVKNDSMPPERESRIVRQSSMKIAFDFVAQYSGDGPPTEEDWKNAEERALALAARLYQWAWGGPSRAPEPEPEPGEPVKPEVPVFLPPLS